MKSIWMSILVILLFLLGCRPETDRSLVEMEAVSEQQQPLQTVTAVPTLVPIIEAPLQPTLAPIPTLIATETAVAASPSPPATPSNQPTQQPSPTNTLTPTQTATNTRAPIPIPCDERMPTTDLLVIVTKIYGISSAYEPPDLTPLSDHFRSEVTLNYPSEVRAFVIEPLAAMISDMQLAGLQPQIISGYRSYIAQAIAYEKWTTKYPDRADILSAPPGHSEHQLGTTVDFGSPELVDLVGPGFQFHTHFYMTSEGIWLAENAHRYGFTLSYPREATELTGFAYEPWHFRYVGVERASWLNSQNSTLTEQQLREFPPPCISNE